MGRFKNPLEKKSSSFTSGSSAIAAVRNCRNYIDIDRGLYTPKLPACASGEELHPQVR